MQEGTFRYEIDKQFAMSFADAACHFSFTLPPPTVSPSSYYTLNDIRDESVTP